MSVVVLRPQWVWTRQRLLAIADRLEKLAPSHTDPNWFHEEKSEIAAELRRLAKGES